MSIAARWGAATRLYPWPRVASSPSTPDLELEALRAGDEAAFAALLDRYHGPLFRLAMSHLRDRDAAEDAVQETWLRVLAGLDRFEGRSSLKTWIFGILLNVARSRRRKESRLLPFTSFFRSDEPGRGPIVDPDRFNAAGRWTSLPDNWENLPESRLLSREVLGRVGAAIDELPPKLREVILLRDIAGLPAADVAGLLGISEANQRVRLHRARGHVRKVLEEYLR
jgi:RNA polymerase sigma-70 factor (ECF subfamily)